MAAAPNDGMILSFGCAQDRFGAGQADDTEFSFGARLSARVASAEPGKQAHLLGRGQRVFHLLDRGRRKTEMEKTRMSLLLPSQHRAEDNQQAQGDEYCAEDITKQA